MMSYSLDQNISMDSGKTTTLCWIMVKPRPGSPGYIYVCVYIYTTDKWWLVDEFGDFTDQYSLGHIKSMNGESRSQPRFWVLNTAQLRISTNRAANHPYWRVDNFDHLWPIPKLKSCLLAAKRLMWHFRPALTWSFQFTSIHIDIVCY